MESVESMKSAIDRVERLLAEGRCAFVAIDGPCASGKTVFAASLHERFGGNVLHMDDFFLRPEQRTPERFAEPGGNVDRERFEAEVLKPLAAGKAVRYRPWDCHTGDFATSRSVEPAALTVVEGSYSMHPALRGYYDLTMCLIVTRVNGFAVSRRVILACCNDSSMSGSHSKIVISNPPIPKEVPIFSSTPPSRTILPILPPARESALRGKRRAKENQCPLHPHPSHCVAPICRV